MPSKTEHELEELLRAATPLPWRDEGYMDHGHTDTFGCNIVDANEERVTWSGYEGLEGSVPRHADAALIVEAVNALPALLTERKRLREALRGMLNQCLPTDLAFYNEVRSLLAEQEATDEQR